MARILLVDDDQDLLNLARKILSKGDHDVVVVLNALEALEVLKHYNFDLVITDANMPILNGFDFAQRLRNDLRFAKMPIALLTGRRDKKDVQRALDIGVDDYIVKPIDPHLFLKKIEALMMKRSNDKALELSFTEAETEVRGQLQVKVKVQTVSEFGMVVISDLKVKVGETVEMKSSIFDTIGIEAPLMKVLSSQPVETSFRVRLMFCGIGEPTLQKIRAWVFSEFSRRKRYAG